ncbi:MAG: UDP-N-acetylglucosamine 1-carboxyvinyltransferase [Hyphomicrobiales bacterium]|nr:MAG: UDP-N-acetylglucosamine 1-carboxyvinyltransferase [Hyphomicrobiales bacterium]
MDRIKITGGKQLHGEIPISGAKNAALPLIIASLLTDETLTLRNVPRLADVSMLFRIIANHGVDQSFDGKRSGNSDIGGQTVHITAREIVDTTAPYELVSKMRASFWVLGPILGRCGYAKVSLPGGCAIGTRPVDLHLEGFRALGASIDLIDGYVIAKAPGGRLKGGKVSFSFASVGATHNVMMAAVLASGETIIENAAREPEIGDLASCLNKMGAKITGIGSSTLTIQGVEKLHGTTHSVLPDRIETGTYAIAATMAGGDVTLTHTSAEYLPVFLDKLSEAGATITEVENGIRVQRDPKTPIKPVDITTQVYPGFPTDLQAQFMALMTIADGSCFVRETIFENRFMHVQELARLGCNITLNGDTAKITGVKTLRGAPVMATDLRASASLIIAALVAKGDTIVNRVYHLDRGFEHLENKFRGCGADVERLSEE